MGRGLLQYPGVRDMYRLAEKVLGYDLLSLCLKGPQDELDRTRHCQPAVFVASLAAVEKLNHRQPKVVESCVAAAGYSVGEFAALVFAGALGFAEALYAVKVRAEAMQKASEAVPSGMLSVIGRREANYKFACLEARKHCELLGIENPVCEISNYLFPDSRVIAGHLQSVIHGPPKGSNKQGCGHQLLADTPERKPANLREEKGRQLEITSSKKTVQKS